mmetsp:Transcript_103032/g.291838  ORF Transcript_103032/g.291838 Transcript_103032/m.291838 type:complete len:371 (-) Transcript_103032:1669-2781(-)
MVESKDIQHLDVSGHQPVHRMLGGLLDESLGIVVSDHQPTVIVLHHLLHFEAGQALDRVDADDNGGCGLCRVFWPKSPCAAIHSGEHAQAPHGAVVPELLEEGRAVVDQQRGAHQGRVRLQLRGAHLQGEALPGAARARHLLDEGVPVFLGKLRERLQNRHRVRLRHAREAHLGDRGVAGGQGSERRPVLEPSDAEVLLDHLGLRAVGDPLGELEGPEEAVQHRQGELDGELLAPAQRGRLRARQIRKPVHEVQRDVLLLDRRPVLPDEGFAELGEKRPRRGLRLHEPAVVELQLALRELDRALLLGREAVEGGEEVWEVVHDVVQRLVVVGDHVPGLVLAVGRVLGLHVREKCPYLHDVMDGCQSKKRN